MPQESIQLVEKLFGVGLIHARFTDLEHHSAEHGDFGRRNAAEPVASPARKLNYSEEDENVRTVFHSR